MTTYSRCKRWYLCVLFSQDKWCTSVTEVQQELHCCDLEVQVCCWWIQVEKLCDPGQVQAGLLAWNNMGLSTYLYKITICKKKILKSSRPIWKKLYSHVDYLLWWTYVRYICNTNKWFCSIWKLCSFKNIIFKNFQKCFWQNQSWRTF